MTTEMNVTIAEFGSLPPGCAPDAITSDGHVVAFAGADQAGRSRTALYPCWIAACV